MSESETRFELPRNLERYLAMLCALYEKEGERQKPEILVNARPRVEEEWSYDSWDGGTYGHALFLEVPRELYLEIVREKEVLLNELKEDLNKIHNVRNEFIAEVFLEAQAAVDRDWRSESGLLRSPQRHVPVAAVMEIWGERGYRVFLSHKAEGKGEAAELKESLMPYGVSAFVAHTDIPPTKLWQEEIEKALSSMDAFVALMTSDFHNSEWTDQEVGYALGRGVPLIAVKLDLDPYGFIGKFQALSCGWAKAPRRIVELLLRDPRMRDAYVEAARRCSTFDDGNSLAEVLQSVEVLTDQQADGLVSAFNENRELQGSYGFNGKKPGGYGHGLASHLSRIMGRKYEQEPERITLTG